MHDEQQRQPAQQPDARTQQVLNRVRHIINKKNTQFILDHQHDSLAALSLYLRDCMEDIGHPPARWRSSAAISWNTASARGKRRCAASMTAKPLNF